jgi:hypothetical protein
MSSPGPADAVGTIRLMLFLPDDAPSPRAAFFCREVDL